MITVDEVSERIREQLGGKLTPDATLDESTVLEQLGLSSLQLSEIVFSLEEEHGVEFDASRAADVKTLGELVAVANEALVESGQGGAAAVSDIAG